MGILELIALLPKRCAIRRRNRKQSATSVVVTELAEKEIFLRDPSIEGFFVRNEYQGGTASEALVYLSRIVVVGVQGFFGY